MTRTTDPGKFFPTQAEMDRARAAQRREQAERKPIRRVTTAWLDEQSPRRLLTPSGKKLDNQRRKRSGNPSKGGNQWSG